MSSFYNMNDEELQYAVQDLKDSMYDVLKKIEICENDSESEFCTVELKKDIQRFLQDH